MNVGEIKHLPEGVRSSVRSGIILFDLTRVVEELIFNSLDAGATKISVAVGAGTSYVKVVDNGCGITRDGMVLLGERYATSKFDQLAVTDAVSGTFGFRGEALSSISDVSLLEVIAKAHGKPNGYRKVVKGCKCLFLGIDDGRQDVGTTVIVRDLFYNQPVRRKHIQSSTKKVLQSVKECVLRCALVHPKVLFKVIDIESDEELFCTVPSSSPLSLLRAALGIEVSSLLHELSVSDGVLKLIGYMSSPLDTTSVKVFQYVYINSRYTCKGPIHKLLNQLATRFNSSDLQKANNAPQNAKRSSSQIDATYILNLSCPRSWYDITFEPSKTSVEFKDWFQVIGFIEKATTRFWSEKSSYDLLCHGTDTSEEDNMRREPDNTSPTEEALADFPANYEISKRRSGIHKHPASFGSSSPLLKMQTKEIDHISNQKNYRFTHHSASEFEEHQTGLEFFYQIDHSLQSCDGLLASSRVTANRESGSSLQAPDNTIFAAEDHFLGNKLFVAEKSNERTDYILDSGLGDEHFNGDANISNGYTGNGISWDRFEIGNDVDKVNKDLKNPFLQHCSTWGSLPLAGESPVRSEGFDFQIDGLRTKRKRVEPDDPVDVGDVDDNDQRFDFIRRAQWQDEAASGLFSPRDVTKCDILTNLDFLSRDSVKSSAIGRECFARENDLQLDSVAHTRELGSTRWHFDSEWSSVMSDPLFGSKSHGVERLINENTLGRCIKYDINPRYDYLEDGEIKDHDFGFYDSMQNSSSRENCSLSRWTNMYPDSKTPAHYRDDICGFFLQHNIDDILFPKYSDTFSDETDWLCEDSRGKRNGNRCAVTSYHISSPIYGEKHQNQKDQVMYQEREFFRKERSSRRHSAPPFYRGKKKFSVPKNNLTMEAGSPKIHGFEDASTSQETGELKSSHRSSAVCQLHSQSNSVEDLLVYNGLDKKKAPDMSDFQSFIMEKKSEDLHIYNADLGEDIQDPSNSGLKWQKSCPRTAVKNGDELRNVHYEDTILDVSSGILHLAGDSLVPESINKSCLEGAKVLQQVDKKFIPIVGSGVLAIIDQHAADERIRLEELRQKVLSGEKKTIAYLDTEHKLVLPEIEYQLLHNYAEQIQNWGWLCNIHAPGSKSFKKNMNFLHKQPTAVSLLAVPCILGVNLTDVDLLEFLQQLADTDGSSTIPPSVYRVLNFKACRGAIMFGDTLLPSECSLIVEELKQTSLCFQCAHGRPTTVPLVNLKALHKQMAKLRSWNGGPNEPWHGLRRHKLSLERAAHRLSSARGEC